MLNWAEIDTVLLDMDGTLLDLHFDNHFWLEHLPKRYADYHQLSLAAAKAHLTQAFAAVAGTLNWYCLDYWEAQLQVPIMALKREVQHLIRMRNDVPQFLQTLRQQQRRTVLVTNAHPASLALKLEHTALGELCDELISTHEFGVSKESPLLWQQLQQKLQFQPERTLFIDDSERILTTAKDFGIGYCWCVKQPDSQRPAQAIAAFPSVEHYHDLVKELA